jgi:hypothetical protein
MSKHPPGQNGRRTKDDLLTQREYADALSVSSGYVSKRTKNDGLLIKDRFDPFHDAQFENGDPVNGDLLGYTAPTDLSTSNGEASPESAQKAAGVSSNGSSVSANDMGNRGNGQPRENPSGPSRSTGPSQSSSQTRGSGLEEALERAGDVAGREVAKSPGALRGLVRLGGSAVGALLAARLVGRGAGPVLLGTAIGFAITEYAIQAEQTEPQKPTRQIRPKGLRQPLRHNLPPGMDQGGSQPPMRKEAVVEKERLARGQSGGK